jgi:hypothetical protein
MQKRELKVDESELERLTELRKEMLDVSPEKRAQLSPRERDLLYGLVDEQFRTVKLSDNSDFPTSITVNARQSFGLLVPYRFQPFNFCKPCIVLQSNSRALTCGVQLRHETLSQRICRTVAEHQHSEVRNNSHPRSRRCRRQGCRRSACECCSNARFVSG